MNSSFEHMKKILESRKKGLQDEATARRSALVDEMIVTQTLKKLPACLKPAESLACSHVQTESSP
jgi:hypothetical protein